MIYHIIQGRLLHLSPNVIKSVILRAKEISPATADCHYFLITLFEKAMPYDVAKDIPYDKLFSTFGFTQYKYYHKKSDFLGFLLTISKKNTIIFHGNSHVKHQLLFGFANLLLRPDLLKRTCLVCWANNDFVKGKKITTRLSLGLLRSVLYSHYRAVITLSAKDKEVVKALYPKAKVFFIPYLSFKPYVLDRSHKNNDGILNIMVAHSGYEVNKHLYCFELLKPAAGKVNVFCPLCYGDSEDYLSLVEQKGRELFGEKFHSTRHLTPRDEYEQLMKSIDVYINAADRQTGLGNTYMLMAGGAKLFMTGNMLSSLRELGYYVNDIEELKVNVLDRISNPLKQEDAIHNVDICNNSIYCNAESMDFWKVIYEQ